MTKNTIEFKDLFNSSVFLEKKNNNSTPRSLR